MSQRRFKVMQEVKFFLNGTEFRGIVTHCDFSKLPQVYTVKYEYNDGYRNHERHAHFKEMELLEIPVEEYTMQPPPMKKTWELEEEKRQAKIKAEAKKRVEMDKEIQEEVKRLAEKEVEKLTTTKKPTNPDKKKDDLDRPSKPVKQSNKEDK